MTLSPLIYSFLNIYHSFNIFLGTDAGELLKKAAEFVLLLLVTYMITSEYTRDQRKELKFLIFGFAVFAFEKLMMAVFYAFVVFNYVDPHTLSNFLPILDNVLEILALILIFNAFSFAIFKQTEKIFTNIIRTEIIIIAILFVISESFWIFTLHTQAVPFNFHFLYLLFQVIKCLLIILAIGIILKNEETIGKYSKNIAFAFFVYLITPLINIINYVFFNNAYSALYVLGHPFPFISIVLFTRVVYLKLVDKAFLREQIMNAKRKYHQEKEISKLKDEFISIVSHELKTPLTSMKLYLGLLLEKTLGDLNKKQKEVILNINQESSRLNHLINDMLDISRLEKKKIKLKIKEVDLNKITEEPTIKALAKNKNIKLKFKIARPFSVKIDFERFKQVYINLMSNAIKFTKENKTITVSAAKEKYGWSFSVWDKGLGIPKDKIKNLFKKFYQVGDHLTRNQTGTGLGLAIVKGIVDLHKGKIDVESKLGKGTKFTVKIPHDLR